MDRTETWREKLECTICLDYSVSPIHNCTNGHIVCGLCAERISSCGLCREKLSISAFAERVAKSSEVYLQCKKGNQDCSKLIKSTEMRHHLAICGHGPMLCPNFKDCPKNPIELEYLEEHLAKLHGVVRYRDKESPIISVTRYFQGLEFTYTTMIILKWFDGRMFPMQSKLHEGVMFEWLSVVGDQSVADKYSFVVNSPIEIRSTPHKSVCYRWVIPVVPIHQSQLSQVKALGYFCSVDASALLPFCKERESPATKIKYKHSYAVQHQITKTEPYK